MRFLRSYAPIAAALAAVFILSACKSKEGKGAAKIDEAMASIISGYPGEAVSVDGPVRIAFVNAVADTGSINKTLEKSPFDFSPSIKGSAVWADDHTLEFRPAARLKRGERYSATLHLDRFMKVPKKLDSFEFKFEVLNQVFERDLGGLEAMDENHLEWQRVGGLLRLADGEDAQAVEKMLTASQDGRTLAVHWEHRSDRREHPFRIDSLRRVEDSSRVILKWDGRPVDADKQMEDTLYIPSISTFTVLAVSAVQGDERYVSVRFSDPTQKGLDLHGLIDLPEQGGLRLQVQGNEVRVYSSNEWHSSKTVQVGAGVRNIFGKPLQNPGAFVVTFEEEKPGVRFVGKGVVMPGSGTLTLPFEAVNLRAVQVTVTRIYAGNVPQFLQVNELEGENELQRVGRIVLVKNVALNPTPSMRPRWARYALDLTELLKKDGQPGSLYRISLNFKRGNSTFPCADEDSAAAADEPDPGLQNWDDNNQTQSSSWDGAETYYEEGGGYNWEDRENPCTPSYYKTGHTASRNFLASNIGLMAKSGGPGKVVIVATDLLTAQPLADADVELLSYQHQVLSRAKTNSDGFAELEPQGKPYLLRATKGDQAGYLKLDERAAIQMGQFDVGGLAVQQGLKGFLFGERGVWRPGDSLHLTFILENRDGRLPEGHPVSFELRDPQNRLVRTLTRASDGGFYSFATATEPDAPTGDYLARVKAGPAVFEEHLKIETVVPNRLKIKIDFTPKPMVQGTPINAKMQVAWLSGAVAKSLEAEVEMTLQSAKPQFPTFSDYVFLDPARKFEPESQILFQGRIDEAGKASFSHRVEVQGRSPGALTANFRTRVLEAGGGGSTDRFSEPFNPYSVYIGMRMPPGDKARGMLLTDTTHEVKLCAVDPSGRKKGTRRVEMKLYQLEWRWWWEQGEEGNDLAQYMSSEDRKGIQEDTVKLVNGEGTWGLKTKYPDWGRYLLRACDVDGGDAGHCTGRVFYMDWPGWAGRAQREGAGGGAAVLSFSSDKPKYTVGEKVRVTIPSPKGGRALVSIEKGGSVFKRYWVDLKEKETIHEFEATADMAPNVYVYVALLQPHKQTENDLPIRMYNVIPIQVEDPATRLHPALKVEPGVFRPGEKGAITVSEKDGKSMHYVVAVVDEGLLDLTRFKTPDPWERFYAREALSVKTWDMYDYVAGAYGDRLERLLSIGGDEGGVQKPDGQRGNRFPPMVKFLGPFTLDKGKTDRHAIDIPQYVGSVRVMVVAGGGGAYGQAEQAVPVRKPLMVLGTLPRVLAPGEEFSLPISVFAMEKHVKDVHVEVTVTGPLKLEGGNKKQMKFSEPSDELVSFSMEAKQAVGWAKVKIKAKSGGETAEQTIEVEVRNPNTPTTDVIAGLVQPGQSWSQSFKTHGVAGTNKATLELSRIPAVDLGKHLSYLIQYPHGCVEQTTSSVFPQLYLDALMDLPSSSKADVERNVKAGVQRLRSFQVPSGGFSYWPGEQQENEWAANYAGHFLVEAEKKGYGVPEGMLDQWKKYQKSMAQGWGMRSEYDDQLTQAYRLYTLALAGAPEMGAMNRLKEAKGLPLAARWQLGGAYQLAGQSEVALSLVKGNPSEVKPYSEFDGTFGSDLRDRAMMLEVLSLMGRKAEATPLMQQVAAELSKPDWYSTQTTAYCLMAMARYAGRLFERGSGVAYSFTLNAASQEGKVEAPVRQVPLKAVDGAANAFEIKNKGDGILYARLILEGVPPLGEEKESVNGIHMAIDYKDLKGEAIDPASLEQGQDFVAEYHVGNPGNSREVLKQLALSSIFPSGWEIRNTRMDPVKNAAEAPGKKPRRNGWDRSDKPTSLFDYQDIRDDRVLTYFNLNVGEEKVFRFFLNASYLGKYHMPQSQVEAMYKAEINARSKGGLVEVILAEGAEGDPTAPTTLGKKEGEGSGDGSGDNSGDGNGDGSGDDQKENGE